MSISNKNSRTMVVLPIELKEKIKLMAEEENRSLSNFILNILKEYVRNKL